MHHKMGDIQWDNILDKKKLQNMLVCLYQYIFGLTNRILKNQVAYNIYPTVKGHKEEKKGMDRLP